MKYSYTDQHNKSQKTMLSLKKKKSKSLTLHKLQKHIKEYIVYKYTAAAVQLLGHSQLFTTPWTVAHQTSLFMGFPRQDYWSGLPFPSSRDLPGSRIKPVSPALAGGFFATETPGKPLQIHTCVVKP